MIPRSPHSLDLRPEGRGIACVQNGLSCGQKACNRVGGKEAEQDVGGSSGTDKIDDTKKNANSHKEESKNEASTTGITNSTEAPDRNNPAPNVPRD